MQTEISKWGNSAATRIPAELMREAGLSIGSKIDIVVENGELKLRSTKPKISRTERLALIIASIEKYGPDEFIDPGPLVGREIIE